MGKALPQVPIVNQDLKEMILLPKYHQMVSSSLTVYHNAYVFHFTSSHHMGILSSHIITRRRRGSLTQILLTGPGIKHPVRLPAQRGACFSLSPCMCFLLLSLLLSLSLSLSLSLR
ncbi:unnamed protein product [Nyctereutes procyonoides]|uniref:(raccoon dog) hypothetical protein n=1 Tax=Nyctereutes procyonoides TaxID=34880 RepID=A0A811ZY87_NYCPR|nr:unnamed protein product [Nyctereutes procyonoides]